jgi:hypothetical protein
MASEPMQKFLIRPGITAVAAGGLTYALYGQGTIDVAGMTMSGVAGI